LYTLIRRSKPWKPEELEILRRLAQQGIPSNVIVIRLGRSTLSIEARARRENIQLTSASESAAPETHARYTESDA